MPFNPIHFDKLMKQFQIVTQLVICATERRALLGQETPASALPSNARRSLPRTFSLLACLGLALPVCAQVDTVQQVAPGVYFHQGDNRQGHSNNGWIVFDDYVMVIDANYPSGAQVVMPKIKELTPKPVRTVFDTHHHGDHAYGNRFWAEAGALVVAQVGVAEEMKRTEPAGWTGAAARRADLRATTHKAPSILFGKDLYFDDGERRVELHYFGGGHTKGDGYAWLPKEKILFTGDACVNGAFNYMGDANIGDWIKTLEEVKKLGAVKVCPGHGPIGGPEIVVDQHQFLVELYKRVKAWREAGKTPADAKAGVPTLDTELKAIPNVARYVGGSLGAQAERVWTELGGAAFPK